MICDLDQNMLQSKYNIHSTIILLQITWVVKLALIMTRRHLCKYYRSALSHTHREIFELQRQQQFIRWPSCRHKRPLARTKSVLSTCLALISLATWPVLACSNMHMPIMCLPSFGSICQILMLLLYNQRGVLSCKAKSCYYAEYFTNYLTFYLKLNCLSPNHK